MSSRAMQDALRAVKNMKPEEEVLLCCADGHTYPPNRWGMCPICNADKVPLSEFGAVGMQHTGSYTAQDLKALEDSHAEMMKALQEVRLIGMRVDLQNRIRGELRNAAAIRRKAGLN